MYDLCQLELLTANQKILQNDQSGKRRLIVSR